MRILFCGDMFQDSVDILTEYLPNDEIRVSSTDPAHVAVQAPWADVLIPTMGRITSDIVDSCPDLKLIQQYGVGLEGVDIDAATAKGIPVANVPGWQVPIHGDCTAEGALFLMMAVARKLNILQNMLHDETWAKPLGMALIERNAVIIGLGAIGQALAKKLVALGMHVSATKGHPDPNLANELGLMHLGSPADLPDLVSEADFVISCVGLTPETHGMLNASIFERMKPTAYVINIGRGPIVNEKDLLDALNSGQIAGAGLDVLVMEPPQKDNPLINHEKVVVTPHIAGVTEQSLEALGRVVMNNIELIRAGKPVETAVNFASLA